MKGLSDFWAHWNAVPRRTYDPHEALAALVVAALVAWGAIYGSRSRAVNDIGMQMGADFALFGGVAAGLALICAPGVLRIIAIGAALVQSWAMYGWMRDYSRDRANLPAGRRQFIDAIDRMNRDYGLTDWLTGEGFRIALMVVVALWPVRIAVAAVAVTSLFVGCRLAWAAHETRPEEAA